MKSTKKTFGEYSNQIVSQFELENDNGMVVKIIDLGATITSIKIPGKGNKPTSIACGFDSLDEYFTEEYRENSPYFGCTVGRYCSQIKDAKFELEGEAYFLAKNCGENNLHGGQLGFDKKMWVGSAIASDGKTGVCFELLSPDMEEGFPGNVRATVEMMLSNNNEIIINYSARTDKLTPLSMTNHTYFNLSGFDRSVEDFKVHIFTDKLQETDASGAGTGVVMDVTNSFNDLREGKVIKDVHNALGDGFEHFYIFDNNTEELTQTAKVEDPDSGRSLDVFSTEPCMLFYTGKYTSSELKRNSQEKYGKYRAFCCETHRWQNGPNIAESPKTFTSPNDVFKSTTVYKVNF